MREFTERQIRKRIEHLRRIQQALADEGRWGPAVLYEAEIAKLFEELHPAEIDPDLDE